MSKFKLIPAILILFLLGACGEDRPGHDLVSKTWDKYYSTSSWESGSLYGGTAILMNTVASYWIKDGQVYTCNGIAMSSSPNTPEAPPSVSHTVVEQAVKGNAPAMPKTFNMKYTEFIDAMLKRLDSLGYRKSIWASYKVPEGGFFIKERGGMLVEARLGFKMEKGKTRVPLKSIEALFLTVLPNISQAEADKLLEGTMKTLIENEGKELKATKGNVHFKAKFYESDGEKFLDIAATPLDQ